MTASADPFDRAVRKEQTLRKRVEAFESPSANIRMIVRWFAVMYVVWGAILTGHWFVLSDPRWLVVLHTVAYVLMGAMWFFGALFATRMTKRREELLGEG